MDTPTRPEPGRSQRDELERLQEDLRGLRHQCEALPAENTGLAAQVARLEDEVRWLRRSLTVAHGEQVRPASSLPERLVLPFRANPSRRTMYGKLRSALPIWGLFLGLWFQASDSLQALVTLGVLFPVCVAVRAFLLEPSEIAEGVAWQFDEEGFAPDTVPESPSKVLYTEVRKVEVVQGRLHQLFGSGAVRVTWEPSAPTSLGKAEASPNRSVLIDLLEEPHRLAAWLRQRTSPAQAGNVGGMYAV
ncbi:hypothetical protein [Stigmatella aurantiaca]|uniref:Uncharacterized protein n=1 Tax=Stigmatella aurantiaca (strain DW4/3-1) TaxID=378806 RepID=Q09DZ0_STIAD|nr:hypothetical protein [Stigmatella aurantiaca]ADO75171.1 uncharacterized protein STAUR_7415 [Stigmatella aurantiaca DW4/3-1]EAU69885.1 hypothetical protein STIAU_5535 [Stigmatella aurantiaca DW4/3-1]